MKIRVLVAVVLLCVSTACSKPVPLTPVSGGATVLAFGDSLTFGLGTRPENSYPAILATMTGLNVINAGIVGETSAEGVARLPSLLAEHRPAIVIICMGGNDYLQRLDEAALERNLRAMVSLVRASGAQAVMLAIPRLGLSFKPSPVYERIASEMNVPLEAHAFPSVLSKGSLKSDMIHPNTDGYREIAVHVAGLLRSSGAIR